MEKYNVLHKNKWKQVSALTFLLNFLWWYSLFNIQKLENYLFEIKNWFTVIFVLLGHIFNCSNSSYTIGHTTFYHLYSVYRLHRKYVISENNTLYFFMDWVLKNIYTLDNKMLWFVSSICDDQAKSVLSRWHSIFSFLHDLKLHHISYILLKIPLKSDI